MWEGNKAQAAALESVMIGGAKRILGCSSRTCNEAVRGDMGLDSLQGRRDKAKLKWWYKVATMPEHRYSRKLFVQVKRRQRKYWCKVVDHLFSSLGLDKAEWLEDIRKGSCSLKSFLGVAGVASFPGSPSPRTNYTRVTFDLAERLSESLVHFGT